MKIVNKLFILFIFCAILPGCSSIVNGTRQKIAVITNPPGVIVTVSDEKKKMHTPAVLHLKRNRDYIITLSKEGYHTKTIKLTRTVSGEFVKNIFGFGITGFVIDTISGAKWKLEPDKIAVHLKQMNLNEALAQTRKLNDQSFTAID